MTAPAPAKYPGSRRLRLRNPAYEYTRVADSLFSLFSSYFFNSMLDFWKTRLETFIGTGCKPFLDWYGSNRIQLVYYRYPIKPLHRKLPVPYIFFRPDTIQVSSVGILKSVKTLYLSLQIYNLTLWFTFLLLIMSLNESLFLSTNQTPKMCRPTMQFDQSHTGN